MRLLVFTVAVLVFSAFAATPDYQTPFQIYASGSPIELSLGHANPLVTDWNGDGLKDLIVGQYTGGKIRYYQNDGTNDSPVFGSFAYMQADGNDISLTSG